MPIIVTWLADGGCDIDVQGVRTFHRLSDEHQYAFVARMGCLIEALRALDSTPSRVVHQAAATHAQD